MLAPLYTAAEMRAAEQGHDVEAMMDRAGRAVAAAVLRRYPEARRVAAWATRAGAGEIDLSMTHSRELAQAVAVVTDA